MLPYVPAPLEDEILGSWLARVATLSGKGAWMPFVLNHGASPKANGFIGSGFASPRNDLLRRIIEGMGYDFEDVLATKTLYPYWTRFSAVTSDAGPFSGRGRMAACMPRWCPACIGEDSHRDWAYWHRMHQLPNVYGCAIHGLQLRDRCSVCGRLPASYAIRSMRPLSALCDCGADLRKQKHPLSPAAAHWQLVNVSCESLLASVDSRIDLSAQLLSEIRALYGQRAPYRAFMEDAARILSFEGMPGLQLSVRSDQELTTRHFCAFFATRGFDLSEGLRTLRKRDCVAHSRASQLSISDMTIGKAKALLKERLRSGRYAGIPANVRTAYLYLRIHAQEWMDTHYPAHNRRPLPSVEADRDAIRRDLASYGSRRRGSSAATRARIRDRSWYSQVTREHAKQTLEQKSRRTLGTRSALVLRSAIELRAAHKFLRINVPSLARLTGLSLKQVFDTIEFDPSLRERLVAMGWAPGGAAGGGTSPHRR